MSEMRDGDIPTYIEALERYIQIFRRGESAVDGIRSELHMIRNDTVLPIHREAIDSLTAHLTVEELALEALGNQVTALWQVQKSKAEHTGFMDWTPPDADKG